MTVSVDEFCAIWDEEVWGAFDEYVDGAFVVLINCSHFLTLRAEWEYFHDVIFVSELLVIITHSIGHLQKCAFCLVTDLFNRDGSFLLCDDGVSI